MAPLSFSLQIVPLSYCVLVFVCLMQLLSYILHRMKKLFNDFLMICNKGLLIHDSYFVYPIVEAFITLN